MNNDVHGPIFGERVWLCRTIEQQAAELDSMDQERKLSRVDTKPVSYNGSAEDVEGADWEPFGNQLFCSSKSRHFSPG